MEIKISKDTMKKAICLIGFAVLLYVGVRNMEIKISKDTMKKAICLIGFAVLLYVGVRNMDVVLQYLGLLWQLMFPFILGCAIAFVLNVPMKFMEKHLFEKARRKGNKAAIKLGRIAFVLNVPMKFMEKHLFEKARRKGNKAAIKLGRPISLLLSILFVVCIVLIVALVVIPELGATFVSVAKQIEKSIPMFQEWLYHTLSQDSPIVEWANSIDFQPGKFYRFSTGKDVGFFYQCSAKRCE